MDIDFVRETVNSGKYWGRELEPGVLMAWYLWLKKKDAKEAGKARAREAHNASQTAWTPYLRQNKKGTQLDNTRKPMHKFRNVLEQQPHMAYDYRKSTLLWNLFQ